MSTEAVVTALRSRWPNLVARETPDRISFELDAAALLTVVREARTGGAWLAGLIAEERTGGTVVSYPLLPGEGQRWLMLETVAGRETLPSVAPISFNADWQEREIEDLFDVHFEGHPQLGDFVLHNEIWPEASAPMRHAFDPARLPSHASPPSRPAPVLHAEGAFTMTVGPIYSDLTESALFRLDTIGEEVISTRPRFFYKYRGLEKLAEGQPGWRALLLAERLNGTSAFAHGLACAQALECIGGADLPPRARRVRLIAGELERLRSHVASIAALLKSTGLSVPTNHCYSLLETLLRLSAEIFGHRYLFGLLVPGGVSIDPGDEALHSLAARISVAAARLKQLGTDLSFDNSFLDRIEEVGLIEPPDAARYGLIGPVGRASAQRDRDLRRRLPYGDYGVYVPEEFIEREGDGYARLRLFLAEADESARLIGCAIQQLPGGPSRATCPVRAGAALGWSEAPAGAAVHWLRTDAHGDVARWRILPPAFTNWHAFHLAAENFAFQDFPITLASMGLSIAEQDR